MLKAVWLREWRLAWCRPGDVLSGVVFFVLVGTVFPLAVGPDANVLRQMAPGVVWVAALMAVLLGQNRLFEAERADGGLEQWLLAPQPLALLVGAKVAAQAVLTLLPLLVAAGLMGAQYGVPPAAIGVILLSLLLGVPSISLLAALGAALTLGVRSPLLLVLVVLPLSIPILIFGSHAGAQALQGLSAVPALNLLGAFLCMAVLGLPWATAAALRLALE